MQEDANCGSKPNLHSFYVKAFFARGRHDEVVEATDYYTSALRKALEQNKKLRLPKS